MEVHIPDILTTDHFSDPEMQVMVRDGVLRRVGYWYSPAWVPDSSGLRARGVFTEFGETVIADTYTAAWIYKCSTRLPYPLTGSMPRSARSASARRLGRIREVGIAETDYWFVGRLRVTTPVRTFRDMGRVVYQKGETHHSLREEIRGRLIAASLAVMFRIDLDAEEAELARQGPYTRRASLHLSEVRTLLARISQLDRNQQLEVLTKEQSKLPGFKLH